MKRLFLIVLALLFVPVLSEQVGARAIAYLDNQNVNAGTSGTSRHRRRHRRRSVRRTVVSKSKTVGRKTKEVGETTVDKSKTVGEKVVHKSKTVGRRTKHIGRSVVHKTKKAVTPQ